MKEFILLQLKLKWGFNRDNNKKSALLTGAAGILVFAVMLALIWLLTMVLAGNLASVTPKRLSSVYVTVIMIGLTVMGITMQIRRMYNPSDLLITARFPLTPFKIYLCNLILIYMELTVYSFMLVLPILLIYGLAVKAFSFVYFLGMLLGAIFAPLLPFALSTLIAIPVMYLISLLENKNVIKVIMFIITLAVFFFLYNYILTVLADYFIHKNVSADTVGIWQKALDIFASPYNLFYYLSGIVFFDGFWMGTVVTVFASAALAALGIVVAHPLYGKVRRRQLEGDGATFRRKTRTDDCSAEFAMLRHGFKEILRTRTYAYFYLGIAVATPVMVFFCDRLVMDVGQASVGADISFGASLLVIVMFMAMISAFSGNVLSMEGKNFYITKLVPVKYTRQLLIKGFLNFCVSTGAMLISCIILVSLKFVTSVETVMILLTSLTVTAGFVFNGMNINLVNPNLHMKANGEADEINITIMMLLGIFIAALLGGLGIVFGFVLENYVSYLILLALTIIYAAINVVVFVKTASKKYSRIEI